MGSASYAGDGLGPRVLHGNGVGTARDHHLQRRGSLVAVGEGIKRTDVGVVRAFADEDPVVIGQVAHAEGVTRPDQPPTDEQLAAIEGDAAVAAVGVYVDDVARAGNGGYEAHVVLLWARGTASPA